ncbi:2-hexaprenyl-6-methoxy-1,4-benzoquinone methyltransferase, partial [Coemansia sp. RSA 1933]
MNRTIAARGHKALATQALRRSTLLTATACRASFNTSARRQTETEKNAPSATTTTTHFGFKTVPTEMKESLVRSVFSSVASKYDLMNDAMSVGIHRLWKDHFIHKMAPAPGAKLLDVAGGTGDIAQRFLQYQDTVNGDSQSSVHLVDINPEMLQEGERRFAGSKWAAENRMSFTV